MLPTYADVLNAVEPVRRVLPPTPLVESPLLSELLGAEVRVKLENLQPVGAFKVRGGVHLVGALSAAERAAGIVTASTGNHGQSIAYAGRRFGVKATVFAPADCNAVKLESMKRLGAHVELVPGSFDEAREACEVRARVTGARYVHSANEPMLIAGVGTMAMEMLDQWPAFDYVFVPVGAGSGACGTGIVVRHRLPGAKVIGVQSAEAPAVHEAWRSGELRPHATMHTRQEGLATRVPFELTTTILRQVLHDFVLVPDVEIDAALRPLILGTRTLVEGAGAAPLAAALRMRTALAGKRIVLVVSGGNIAPDRLAAVLATRS